MRGTLPSLHAQQMAKAAAPIRDPAKPSPQQPHPPLQPDPFPHTSCWHWQKAREKAPAACMRMALQWRYTAWFSSPPLLALDYLGKELLFGFGAPCQSSPVPNQAAPQYKGSAASPLLPCKGSEPGEKPAALQHPDMFIALPVVAVCFYSGNG